MKPLRPTRTTLILSLCLAAMAGLLWFQHHQTSLLNDRLMALANNEPVIELSLKLRDVEERLDQLDGKTLVSDEDFRSALQALSNRIDAAQLLIEQAAETGQQVSRNAASASELLTLKADVETLATRLHQLSQVQTRQPSTSQAKPRQDERARKPRATVTQASPPFTVVGIEYRGGERFLSVGPPDSSQLNQLYLIQPGEVVTGTTCHLTALEGDSAHFDVAGTPQVVTVGR